MTEIRKTNAICTQITTVKLPPGKQEEALNLMIERARFMATQPGFVSVNLHRSQDGSHLINYTVDEPREAQGGAPIARVSQEVAAIWRND